ncbi:MAG: hypothetical protein JNK53_05830 [Phycisphaerae bacterium]|nr:hypothetical protein [Phycisphaerae bacterium]
MENYGTDFDESPRRTTVSPTAVLLTGAAVVAAVVLGLMGPRLRDRHGSSQQELPVGELAYTAEHREAQQAFDVARKQSLPVSDDRLATLSHEVFGHVVLAPNLAAEGFALRDARVVELAPDNKALALFHKREKGEGMVTLFGLKDEGRFIRFDGFGSALPLAPGDEWVSGGLAERDGPPRIIYAVTDGSMLWLMLASDARTVVELAPSLAPRVRTDAPKPANADANSTPK